MHIHPSILIVLLLCSQAVNKDGAETCTLPDPNPVYGLYIGQLDSSHYCEALTVRRSMITKSQPDVFCVGNKIFRIINGPLRSDEYYSRFVECVVKKICMEDLEQRLGISSRWMRLACAEGHLYFNKKPEFVHSKQIENILGMIGIV